MDPELTLADLERLRQGLVYATPGPWLVERGDRSLYTSWFSGPVHARSEDDAKLVSDLRRLAPALIKLAEKVLSPQRSLEFNGQ